MSAESQPQRYIGLDVHKHYLIAIGVNPAKEQVFGPQRVPLEHLMGWAHKYLTAQDAVALEVTTNTCVRVQCGEQFDGVGSDWRDYALCPSGAVGWLCWFGSTRA